MEVGGHGGHAYVRVWGAWGRECVCEWVSD